MKFNSIILSTLSLVAFAQAMAIAAPHELTARAECPKGTAKAGKNHGLHGDSKYLIFPYSSPRC
ncbi:hypothetical protein BT63DRAFT_422691 [Microthyrium microscopicum]|uniref:Uncharacterized protein n=1 Tax=Microthyrium microscopicum TaxID=703497 RepID=A0A6A6UM91_9PEZI|nr:hypothetical protein BT63DRAFT_422691 [Microthyrium microscopicum]